MPQVGNTLVKKCLMKIKIKLTTSCEPLNCFDVATWPGSFGMLG